MVKMTPAALASTVQLIGVLSYAPEGHRFDSWSGHIPKLRV